jgi:hydroxyisourate hydrolase
VSLSTHVLDTTRGEPVEGVEVSLLREDSGTWVAVAHARTGVDGRLGTPGTAGWVPAGEWQAGRFRLVFDTGPYLGPDAFFPQVIVDFTVGDPDRHHHVPLLLSPYGYTTYRGS